MQYPQWYGNYIKEEPGLMIDFHNKYLGVARLLQNRVKLLPCKLPKIMDAIFPNLTCKKDYWFAEKNERRYGRRIIPTPLDRLTQIWNFTTPKEAGYSVSIGKFGVYNGGGFIAPLGRSIHNSYVNLRYFEKNAWLDRATASVFLEFLVYNVNTNLFSAVQIMIELSATGFIRTKTGVNTAQLLFKQEKGEFIQFIIIAAFFLIVIIFTLKLIWRLGRKRVLFFKDLWSLLDLIIVALSYWCFAIFLQRMEMIKTFVEAIEKAEKNQFINYFVIFHEELVFVLSGALLVFVATIRLWKLFRFATNFKIMEKTIGFSKGPLAALFFCHFFIILLFSLCGYQLFSGVSEDFKDFSDTIITMLLLAINLNLNFDLNVLYESGMIGCLFYMIYMVFSLLIVTIYVAVIMICYYEAQLFYSQEKNDFEVFKNYVSSEFGYFSTLLRIKLTRERGGYEDFKEKNVIAMCDEQRYADCFVISTNKMELMNCIARHALDNHISDEKKMVLMLYSAKCFIEKGSDEKEIFFQEKTEENKIVLIHDNQLVRMERIVEKLLEKSKNPHVDLEKMMYYRAVVDSQNKKLDYFDEVLKILLNIFEKIDIKV